MSDSQKPQPPSNLKTGSASADHSRIGPSLVIKGEVNGSESVYIDGRIEGILNVGNSRVTIASNGSVAANIIAGEVLILGSVQGNIQCSDRLDIRSDGSLIGDVITQRISVEDRAVLKGSVEVQAAEHRNNKSHRQAQQVKASAAVAGA
jgi:cytoskeletal protein CcmA (bactofilin family)